MGCAAVLRKGCFSLAFSSGFDDPPTCATPALQGQGDVGPGFDRVWRKHRDEADPIPSGRCVGNIGKLLLSVLPRCEYARHVVVGGSFLPFHLNLYPESNPARAPESGG